MISRSHTRAATQARGASQPWQAVRDQIDACRRQLRQCDDIGQRLGGSNSHPEAEDNFEAECAWLGKLIHRAHLRMILLLEQLGTKVFLEEYRAGFVAFAGKLDEVYQPDWDPDRAESEALDYVCSMLNLVSASLEPSRGGHEIDALMQIKGILEASDFILARAGKEPASERDVQNAVFEYLQILYPGTRREVAVSHVLKTFKADIGIDALGLLIEIKFIDSPVEARNECPGLFEDMFGYRGDAKWKHHFALVYTTGPHVRASELEAEFELAECPVNWTPIVVRGDGERPRRTAASTPHKPNRGRRAGIPPKQS